MIKAADVLVRAPDGRELLKGIFFELKEGEKLAFSGPNGCGKSTLLREIAGLEDNSDGISRSISATQMSYLPTRPLDLLLPWNTVNQNIMMFTKLAFHKGVDSSSLTNSYGRIFGYDLSPMADKETYRLSSGQQALLAIFCAVIQRPKVLIADEIFSTLSETVRSSVASALKDLKITTVCATHDSDFIEAIEARVFKLDTYVV